MTPDLVPGNVDATPLEIVSPTFATTTLGTFDFTVGRSGDLDVGVASLQLGGILSISDLTATLDFNGNPIGSSTSNTGSTSFDVPGAPTGSYALVISGHVDGFLGGVYEAGVASVASVPIPNAAWLLLSGVAGVATMSRRRRPQEDGAREAIA
jgi:hypothetical protein